MRTLPVLITALPSVGYCFDPRHLPQADLFWNPNVNHSKVTPFIPLPQTFPWYFLIFKRTF